MVYGIDPVGAGFIKGLAHPGGNITGGTFEASPLIYGKKLEYLKQINPKLTRVALLWNPAATTARAYFKRPKKTLDGSIYKCSPLRGGSQKTLKAALPQYGG